MSVQSPPSRDGSALPNTTFPDPGTKIEEDLYTQIASHDLACKCEVFSQCPPRKKRQGEPPPKELQRMGSIGRPQQRPEMGSSHAREEEGVKVLELQIFAVCASENHQAEGRPH